MSRKIEDLGTKILTEAPGTCAAVFVGIGLYVSEVDSKVRNDWPTDKQNLSHWAKVFGMAKVFMPIISLTGTLMAVGAYYQTKEKFWLYGGATLASIIPYTLLTMMKTNNYLNGVLKNSEDNQAELEEIDRPLVREKLKEWVSSHRVRVVLATAALGLFFWAKHGK